MPALHRHPFDRPAATEWEASDVFASLLAELHPAWQQHAACRGMGHEVWFARAGEGHGHLRAICAGCPVQQTCLDWALDHNITWGFWGGKSDRERRRIRRQRREAA